ncbi:Antitoxin PezA [Dyella sp. AD56]|nr:Antitoxin PezA [Dyella sp. AD56]
MLASTSFLPDTLMAPADRAFYEQLGQRIAEHRKARGITQVELAKTLGIAQQTLAHYEGGTVRIAVATLTVVAKALDVAMEDLLGSASAKTAGKRGPAPKLQRQLELVSQLPKAKQRLITEVLDSMLAQAGR